MRRNYIASFIVSLLILVSMMGTVLGKETSQSLDRIAQVEVSSENKTNEEQSINSGDVEKESKEAVEEPNFLMKLGTFLFITAVLLFLIQWQHKKKND